MNEFRGSIKEVRTAGGRVRFDVTISSCGRRERKRFLRRREGELWLKRKQLEAAEGQFMTRPERVSFLVLGRDFLCDSQARKSKNTFQGVDATRLLRFTRFAYKELRDQEVEISAHRFAEIVMAEHGSETLEDGERALVRFMSGLRLERVDAALLERYQQSLLRQVRPVSAKDYIVTLKVALNRAVRKGWLAKNPASALDRIDVPKKMPRFLLKDEIAAILRAAVGSIYFGWVATGIFGGLRRGELAHLEWPDIDFENNLIMIRAKPEWDWAPKRRRERTVPLEPLLKRALLPLRPESRRGLCFPNEHGKPRDNNVVRDMKELCEKAKIKPISTHGLRHTYGSHMAMANVPLPDIRDWMGHSSIEVTEIYAHLAPGRNRFRRDSVFDVETPEELMAIRRPGEVVEMPPRKGEHGEAQPVGAV
jgi:integrase